MRSYRDLMAEARVEVPEISVHEVKRKLDANEDLILLDIRDNDEYRAGSIPGALYISRGMLEFQIESRVPDRDRPIYVYCAGGFRSLLAAQTLKRMGYAQVASVAEGYNGWVAAGYPIVKPRSMTVEQQERYSRHIILREVGEEGQARLLDSKVLLVGAGGLGSPAAIYLAAAGVGTLGIVDSDRVDLSNLQRQILHTTERVGLPKTESAKQTIEALNSDVQVNLYPVRLDVSNAMEILRDYDVVLDGADNFPTRYLINDAATLLGKPVVHGSIFQFEGQATVLFPPEGPCYRCLYPSPPPPGLVPT